MLIINYCSFSLGNWLPNPYTSFCAGALAEMVGYFVVHLVLNKWGRKIPYCVFVSLFGIFAFLVIPVQMMTEKDGPSI